MSPRRRASSRERGSEGGSEGRFSPRRRDSFERLTETSSFARVVERLSPRRQSSRGTDSMLSPRSMGEQLSPRGEFVMHARSAARARETRRSATRSPATRMHASNDGREHEAMLSPAAMPSAERWARQVRASSTSHVRYHSKDTSHTFRIVYGFICRFSIMFLCAFYAIPRVSRGYEQALKLPP